MIGWITVVSAAISLLALPALAAILVPPVGLTGRDRASLPIVSLLTKAADLPYRSWVTYVLQLKPAVCTASDHRNSLLAGTTSA